MRQYDVYMTPLAATRAERPYVLVLQHPRVPFTRTVVIAPLSRIILPGVSPRLGPLVEVLDTRFQLITQELAFMPAQRLRGPAIDNLEAYRFEITSALDHLFSAAG